MRWSGRPGVERPPVWRARPRRSTQAGSMPGAPTARRETRWPRPVVARRVVDLPHSLRRPAGEEMRVVRRRPRWISGQGRLQFGGGFGVSLAQIQQSSQSHPRFDDCGIDRERAAIQPLGLGVIPGERLLPTGADLAANRDPVLARAPVLAGIDLSDPRPRRAVPVRMAVIPNRVIGRSGDRRSQYLQHVPTKKEKSHGRKPRRE